MGEFLLVTDKDATGLSALVLVSKRHIEEVRPLGNPISDGAVVVTSTGRRLHTKETFDELAQKLYT